MTLAAGWILPPKIRVMFGPTGSEEGDRDGSCADEPVQIAGSLK